MKVAILTIYFLLFGAMAVQAQELKAFSDNTFSRFGKWGFKDQNGKVIVEPKYDSFGEFSEGLAWVKTGGTYDQEYEMFFGGKVGFINNTGKEAIGLKYESAKSFTEGLAAVKVNGRWGYINKIGEEIIPFLYSEAFIFVKGKASVKKTA